jgi:hypothetical protein
MQLSCTWRLRINMAKAADYVRLLAVGNMDVWQRSYRPPELGRGRGTGSDGSKYLIIFFCENLYYIHVVGVKSRSASENVRAMKLVLHFFACPGDNTLSVRMDNECPAELKDFVLECVHDVPREKL